MGVRRTAGSGHLYAFEDGPNICDQLLRTMRFPEKPGHSRGHHPIEPFLGNKAGAQENHRVGANGSETAERFLAVHERHREIEQNEIEVVRALAEEIQAFKG
jgi:hypothetical protein